MKMSFASKILFLSSFYLVNFFIACATLAQSDVLFILDASGSMRQSTAGQTQISAAKDALKSALVNIPNDVQVGLRVYAHRQDQSDKQKSCSDSELVAPIAASGGTKILSALSSIEPKGFTPISYSLEQAKSDFDITRESEKTIILLSDGEETCGGDPAATVSKLISEGFKFTLHVIGFNVDAKTKAQLEAASNAGGGMYFNAKDAKELSDALSEATKKSLVIDKPKTVYGTPIRGGNSFETAISVQPGIEYKLDHHQKDHEYDYFSIPVKAGKEIAVTLKTLEKGIQIREDGKTIEGDSPYFGAKLNAHDRTQLVSEEIIGKKFETRLMQAPVSVDGNYYLLVGSEYADINMDHATFTVNLVSRGDLDSEVDAGQTMETALNAQIGTRYKLNYLGGYDKVDTYSFTAKASDKFFVGFIPDTGYDYYTYVKVLTEFKEPLTSKSFSGGKGGKTDTIQIDEDGTYYLEVSVDGDYKQAKAYAFEIRKISNPTAPVSEGNVTQ